MCGGEWVPAASGFVPFQGHCLVVFGGSVKNPSDLSIWAGLLSSACGEDEGSMWMWETDRTESEEEEDI